MFEDMGVMKNDYTENGDEFLQADLNNILQKLIPDNIAEGQYNYPGEKHYEAVVLPCLK